MRKKVYIAAAFRSLSNRTDKEKAYGELNDSDYIGFLEEIEQVFLDFGLATCLPHRDEGQWGRSYYEPSQIAELCLRHVATSDLVFAIAEKSRGVHIELGFASAFPEKSVLSFYEKTHEPSTLVWALAGNSFVPSVRSVDSTGARVVRSYSSREDLLLQLRKLLSEELGFERVDGQKPRRRLLGIIDIGSHTLKYRLFSYSRGGASQVVHKEGFSLGIMGDVLEAGEFSRETLAELVQRLTEWLNSGREMGAENFKLIGTEALRRAKNSEQVLVAIEEATGLAVQILEHSSELSYVFSAVARDFYGVKELSVLNLGGGSTQVGVGSRHSLRERSLLRIGTRQVMQRHPWKGPLSDSEYSELLGWVKEQVRRNLLVPARAPEVLVHTGGELDFLMRCRAPLKLSSYSPSHVSQISLSDFLGFSDAFRRQSVAEVVAFSGLDPSWAEGAVASNAIAATVAEALGARVLVPSNLNVSDGLLGEL